MREQGAVRERAGGGADGRPASSHRLSSLSMEPVRMSSAALASSVVTNLSCACTIPLGPALRRTGGEGGSAVNREAVSLTRQSGGGGGEEAGCGG
jgi:hypothetical protein